jgi:hypothetical protein
MKLHHTLSIVATLALAASTHATLIWDGSPSKGLGVFKNINIQDSNGNYVSNPSPNGSYARAGNDSTYGAIWDFYKAANDRRCEAHGASGFNPAIGSQYYIGWGFKCTSTTNDNAIFQWKSYGSPMVQNYPYVMKFISGNVVLQYYPPNSSGINIWQHSVSANTWYKVYLRIKVSDQTSGGSISLWFNGSSQTFTNGSTSYTGKSFDGSSVDPKWGKYGAVGTGMHDYVRHLRIGTALSDVQF